MTHDAESVFVAGATGLAGSSVIRALLRAEPDVRIRGAHRGNDGCFVEDRRVEYVRGDLRDAEQCRQLVRGCGRAVLTAANTGGARQAVSEPWRQVTDNIVMDAHLLQALSLEGVRRAVYVSSATVYPDVAGVLAEDGLDWNLDPPAAHLGIGWAKRSAEKLCRFWHEKAGIDIVVARAANIYGPHARFDPATANFIPALVRKAADHLDPFEVWGTPDVTRDVVFADDFGRAVARLLGAAHIRFDVMNVGSGRPTTVGEVVDIVLRLSGHRPSRVDWRSDGPTTVPSRHLDCSRIRDLTGWEAVVSVEEGISMTYNWWLERRATWTR